jgi:DNA-binding NtrC family response regulator
MVQEALVGILEMLGYRTVQAANGHEALIALERQTEKIALVLSDLVMPEMGGQSLLYAMRERGVMLPMIFLSGHPVEDDAQDLQEHGVVGWLNKPPDVDALSEMLAHAFNHRSM